MPGRLEAWGRLVASSIGSASMSARSPITLSRPCRRLLALDDADDAGAAEAGDDLVAAEFAQAIRDECRGAVDVIEQFRVFMDIAAPGLNIGLKIGDAVDDGHANSRPQGWNARPLSSMQAAVHPTPCRRGPIHPEAWPTRAEARAPKGRRHLTLTRRRPQAGPRSRGAGSATRTPAGVRADR